MSINRWSSGCGGGPITSGCTVWPTTRPPASTVGADSYGALSAMTTMPRLASSALSAVYCSRGTPRPGENTSTGHAVCVPLTGASKVAWVSISPKAAKHERGQTADRARQPALGLEVGDPAAAASVGRVPGLGDDLPVIGPIGRERLRSGRVGPAEDLAGDAMGPRGLGQLRHQRRRQSQGAEDHAGGQRSPAGDPHWAARTARPAPAQRGGERDTDGESLPRDQLPARPAVEDQGGGRQYRGDGREALERIRPAVARTRPPQCADQDGGD